MNKENKYPKITVVTPNFNQGDFIEQTICSVLDQGYPNLEYIIIDGGSKDNSVEIIRKYEKQLTYWVSESDKGMYDAINKGFSKATGDIMCWINSDDILWENSLFNVAEIFNANPKVHWIQGLPSVIDELGELVFQRQHIFSSLYFYLKVHKESTSFIQQESTFWTKKLWDKAGGYLSLDYDLASDFDLWMRFFKYEKMYCTNEQLAAFRTRKGQQSSNLNLYLSETEKSLDKNLKELNIKIKVYINILIVIDKITNKIDKRTLNKMFLKMLIGKPKLVYLSKKLEL